MPQISPLLNVQPDQVVPPAVPTTVAPEQVVPPVAPIQVAPVAPTVPVQPAVSPVAAPGFDPTIGTVEGRVANIIRQGGPLQQVAETQALQQAGQRGLLNTSMAIQAARMANIEAALPIAQQDAGFFQQRGLIEAQTAAESGLMAQKAGIDQQLLTAGADEQVRLILEKGKVDTALQELRGVQETAQVLTRGQVESGLVQQRGDIEMQLQTAQGDERLTLLNRQGELDTQLVALRHDNTQEILSLQEATEKRLTDQRASISTQLLTAEGAQKEALLKQQGQLDVSLAVERGRIASDLQNELFEINAQLETMRAGLQIADLKVRQQHDTQLTELKGVIETQLQGLIGSQALEQQGLKGEQATNMQEIEKNYQVLISTQRVASITFAETSNAISMILSNPDIPTDAKPGLIKQQMTLLDTSLAVMGGIADKDLVGLFDLTTSGTEAVEEVADAEAEALAAVHEGSVPAHIQAGVGG